MRISLEQERPTIRSDGYEHGATVPGMVVRKLSVALDESVADAAGRAADRTGLSLSAWLNQAAERELAIDAGLGAVREWEAEQGVLTAEELAAADALLDRTARSPRRAD